MNREDVDMWRSRFEQDSRCTMVESIGWNQGSRDPTDNMFLAAARAGKAKYLISPRSFLRVTGLG